MSHVALFIINLRFKKKKYERTDNNSNIIRQISKHHAQSDCVRYDMFVYFDKFVNLKVEKIRIKVECMMMDRE